MGDGMKRVVLMLSAACVLAGCETVSKPDNSDASTRAVDVYLLCVKEQAIKVAPQQGGPLELGMIAETRCSSKKNAWADAIAMETNRGVAERVVRGLEADTIKTAASIIVDTRSKM